MINNIIKTIITIVGYFFNSYMVDMRALYTTLIDTVEDIDNIQGPTKFGSYTAFYGTKILAKWQSQFSSANFQLKDKTNNKPIQKGDHFHTHLV